MSNNVIDKGEVTQVARDGLNEPAVLSAAYFCHHGMKRMMDNERHYV